MKDINFKGKLIMIMGPPASGKSTLASEVHTELKKELMFLDSKDYIICDSSSILNYFYFRNLFDSKLSNKDIASINHLQKEILKHINTIDEIFYVPAMSVNDSDDGIRFHDKGEIEKLGTWIKSYLEIENIKHIDLSNENMDNRVDFIIKSLIK